MSLIAELKRRNVFRVAMLYVVFSWLILQVADVLFGVVQLPEWSLTLVAIILGLGFLPALVVAWIYEMTPEGIKREKDIDRSQSLTDQTGRKINASILLVLTVAVVILAVREFWPRGQEAAVEPGSLTSEPAAAPAGPVAEPAASTHDGRVSVAVLPFVNMSDDPGNEYFSDGISEELLNVLVGIDQMRVPSRTSSFRYKGSDQSLRAIAKELDVDHVLEGSVRKAGDQVRITAQLIEVETDTHLWSATYTRTLDDIFAIQNEIANAIVDQLRVTLGADDELQLAGTTNSEAYNHYLKGRFFWHQRRNEAFESALRELRAAVELDPGFEDAWAALADVYVLLPEYGAASREEAIPKARAALERALAINAESAQALTTRGYLRFAFDWRHEEAESDFRAALDIDPNYATAHQWYGEFLTVMRRYDEALEHALRAVELDPLTPVKPMVAGNALAFAGRAEESLSYYRQAIELSPGYPGAMFNLVFANLQLARTDEALDIARELVAADTANPRAPLILTVEALAGIRPVAATVEELITMPNCDAYTVPRMLLHLGETDGAIDKLRQCIETGHPYSVWANTIPAWELVRDDPRFLALLATMNLPAGGGT